MNVHRLQREHSVAQPPVDVFDVFADAHNLERIFTYRHEAVPRLLA
ncbi:MAG TPA: hypothetical protein VHW04_20355 [Solirubrobacteraceae bacterium]|nr:hypothetical protein [Solirubrobacteraceae bacterium]